MAGSVDGASPAPGPGREWRYPPADRDDLVETWHGTPVADPYRWLEEPGAARTRRWVAAQREYGLNQAGSDWTTWRVRDVTTGVDLEDRVTHAKFGSPRWLPSSGGFLYWGFPAAARTSGDDPAALPTGSLRCHRLGTPEADDQVVHRPATPREAALGQVTDDGRWLVLTLADGIARRNRVAVRRIGAGDLLGPRLDVVGEAYARFELAWCRRHSGLPTTRAVGRHLDAEAGRRVGAHVPAWRAAPFRRWSRDMATGS